MLQPRDLKGRTAISYARWSSGRQADGDSLRRQSENAEHFCASFGLTLDRTLVDDGVSAFKGGNLDLEASLGKFIADVKAGVIPLDTVFLLENLDRFTRINPVDAIPALLDLLKTGLTLVTLQDQRVHTRGAYAENPMHLMMSLVSMQSAYDYSAKLSQRVGAEWDSRAERARQAVASGMGRVKMSKVPFWIDQQTQELNERAEDAKLIFQLSKEGNGQWSITNQLNERGIPSPRGGTWGKSVVQAVLKMREAYGSLVIKGEEVRDYYPPLISETEWLAIQQRQRMRQHNPQASGTANLFPRLLRCAHCGHPMGLTTSNAGGATWRYLICQGKAYKRTDCTQPNWRYDDFEAEFIDRIGFLAVPIPQADGQAADLSRGLDDAISALEFKRENVLAGVAEADTADVRKVLLGQADTLSRQIEAKRKELVTVRENAARHQEVTAKGPIDFEEHQEELRRLTKEDRKGAQRMIADMFEKIELESASKELRRANVTLRGGIQHSMVFEG